MKFVGLGYLDPMYCPVLAVWALLVPIGIILLTGMGCACAYGVYYFNFCRFCLCLFFQLLWVIPLSIWSDDVSGNGCSQGDSSSN